MLHKIRLHLILLVLAATGVTHCGTSAAAYRIQLPETAPPTEASGLIVLRILWIERWNGTLVREGDWVGNFVHYLSAPGEQVLRINLYSQQSTKVSESTETATLRYTAQKGQTMLLCTELHNLNEEGFNWKPFLMPMPGVAPGHILTPSENTRWLNACTNEMQRRMDAATASAPKRVSAIAL